MARQVKAPRTRARTLGNVVELTSTNPAATNRLLIARGAQVVEHDETAGRVRTVLAAPARDHFWVVVGEERRTASTLRWSGPPRQAVRSDPVTVSRASSSRPRKAVKLTRTPSSRDRRRTDTPADSSTLLSSASVHSIIGMRPRSTTAVSARFIQRKGCRHPPSTAGTPLQATTRGVHDRRRARTGPSSAV